MPMGIKLKMYELLVNRDPKIKLRYERFVSENQELHSSFRFASWLYLMRLNIESMLGILSESEKIAKSCSGCESALGFGMTAAQTAEKLCCSDIVSFDVFDTLIFRPFDSPKSVFYLVGEKLGCPDFRNIRISAEAAARKKCRNGEAGISDIYRVIHELTGIPAEAGMKAELETELEICCVNPFMLDVWSLVRKNGKKIIVTSDMYLPSEFIGRMLEKNGFSGYENIFVSCEHFCGKYDGSLFHKVKEQYGGLTISHVGDNYNSDVKSAEKSGISPVYYPNVNASGNKFRTNDMSYIIGSAYRGIVNNRLYCGKEKYLLQYEFGYRCGGIIALGYCSFIHKHYSEKNADKILFFSRDGYVLKKIYDKLYPDDNSEYFYWSRAAAAKLGAELFPSDYFRRFVYQKVNSGYSISEIQRAMGIEDMSFGIPSHELLTSENADRLCSEMKKQFDDIIAHYSDMNAAFSEKLHHSLKDCKNILTVDCGWAGSGSIVFEAVANRKFGCDVNVTGLLAGTNSFSQHDSDFSESYLQSGKLIPYCFSSSLNRDIYKTHSPSQKHNVYFEMLFGAPEPSVTGFALENGECVPIFEGECENEQAINDIHRGEMDFAEDYAGAFKACPYMLDISGRDAYAAISQTLGNKKLLKNVFAECVFDEHTSGTKVKII